MFGKPNHNALVGDGLPGSRSGAKIEHHVRNSAYLKNLLYWATGLTSVPAGSALVLNVLGIPIAWFH